MDATSVKAELKAWEHAFLAKHGHTATRDDIKADPIAEKYKLYKKLMKEADNAQQENGILQATKRAEPPRTPPRPPRASSSKQRDAVATIIPKSRPTTSSVSTATMNPFSPMKKKQSSEPSASTSLNPFITPVKSKQWQRKRTPSPDLFISSSKNPPTLPIPEHNPGLSKARKRLRGESVSPSPQPRDKRSRAGSLAVAETISLKRVTPGPVIEEGDSFVDDSPVKAPVIGKAFKPLFEEVLPRSQPAPPKGGDTTRGRTFARSKTMPGGLFGSIKKNGENDREGWAVRGVAVPLSNGKGKGKEAGDLLNESKKLKKKVLPGPKGLIPGKDDLFSDVQIPIPAQSNSRKRNFSKSTDEDEGEEKSHNGWNLLPPSPPPQNDTGRYNPKGKGKAPLRKGKKVKRSSDAQDKDVEESSDREDVKIITLHARPDSPEHEDELALGIDPELQRHLQSRTGDRRTRSLSPQLARFDVDLPEEMQRMLALSPTDADREKEEEHLVKSLMRGRRRGIAEVWGAGEFQGESEGVDDMAEDDWEGEGVPWEVAEL